MKAIFVAFATTDGHTATIAEKIREQLVQQENSCEVFNISSKAAIPPLDTFDGVILAGSVHMGRHQEALHKFCERNAEVLAQLPVAFISVSASASRDDEESKVAAQESLREFLTFTRLCPSSTLKLGGAILYTKYKFITKLVMKSISEKRGGPVDMTKDHILTDWDQLSRFVNDFLTKIDEKITLIPG